MNDPSILFEEIKIDTALLLQEIGTPGLKRNVHLPQDVAKKLRKQQITRLEENIAVLRKKQEEFHQKMEDYIASLGGLINNLRQGLKNKDEKPSDDSSNPRKRGGTYVRCVGCGAEQDFPAVDILFAREPEDMFSKPIEVIVQEDGKLKKGVFRCPRCGNCNLSPRPLSN